MVRTGRPRRFINPRDIKLRQEAPLLDILHELGFSFQALFDVTISNAIQDSIDSADEGLMSESRQEVLRSREIIKKLAAPEKRGMIECALSQANHPHDKYHNLTRAYDEAAEAGKLQEIAQPAPVVEGKPESKEWDFSRCRGYSWPPTFEEVLGKEAHNPVLIENFDVIYQNEFNRIVGPLVTEKMAEEYLKGLEKLESKEGAEIGPNGATRTRAYTAMHLQHVLQNNTIDEDSRYELKGTYDPIWYFYRLASLTYRSSKTEIECGTPGAIV